MKGGIADGIINLIVRKKKEKKTAEGILFDCW